MDKEQHKWDVKYQARPLVAPAPIAYIEQSLGLMKPGKVLDLACGDGSAALTLAKAGFEVTAVDISPVALERLSTFANQAGVTVKTLQFDLSKPELLVQLVDGLFDNIVITHFKPSMPLWHALVDLLADDGRLLLTSFNLMQYKQHGFNEKYCLKPAEFTGKNDRLHLLYSASVRKGGNFYDEYLFERKG